MYQQWERKISLFFICLLSLANTLNVNAQNIAINESTEELILTRHWQYVLADAETADNLANLKQNSPDWLPYDSQFSVNRPSKHGVWFKVDIQTDLTNQDSWVLKLFWPTFSQVGVYLYDPELERVSDAQSVTKWAITDTLADNFPFAFKLQLPKNKHLQIYLYVDSHDKILPSAILFNENKYQQWRQDENIIIGLFTGIMLAMLLYHLSLFSFLRERIYLTQCAFIAMILLYASLMSGIGVAHMWGGHEWFNAHAYILVVHGGFLFGAIFFKQALNLKMIGGRSLFIADTAIILELAHIVLTFFTSSAWLYYLSDFTCIYCCLAATGVTVYQWSKGNTAAKYLIIGWSGIILLTLFLMLQLMGILIYQALTINFQQIGFGLEAILLSMTLAKQINNERQLRADAQSIALKASREATQARQREVLATERQLESELRAKSELEAQVKSKTRDLHQALERLERLNVELKQQSEIDVLTGLYNRRHFNLIYAEEYNRAVRTLSDLSVIMIDIDYFKHVNDQYGHPAGDSCLSQVAKLIRSLLQRNYDYCARYGGEEFCVLLPQQNSQLALKVAEKIRHQAEQLEVDLGDKVIHITLSLGIASIKDEHANAENLLNRADSALYKAKDLGRNRVCIYEKNTD